MRNFLVLVFAMAWFGTEAFALDLIVKKETAAYSEASSKSTKLSPLAVGTKLEGGERLGMYWSVKLDGRLVFVKVLDVQAAAPNKSFVNGIVRPKSASSDGLEDRQRTSVMGVRGLAPDDDMANAGNVRPNLRAVFVMEEDASPSPAKVIKLQGAVMSEIEAKAN